MTVAVLPRRCDLCGLQREVHQTGDQWVCRECYSHAPDAILTDEELAQPSPAAEPEKPKPARQAPAETDLAYVQRVLGLPWGIIGVSRPMVHPDAAITIELDNGETVRWEQQRHLFRGETLFMPFGIRGIKRPKDLAKIAADVGTAICAAAGILEEHDEGEEATEWGKTYLGRDKVDANVEEHRYAALKAYAALGGDDDPGAHTIPVLRCAVTRDRYIRRGLFARWLRETYRVQLSSAAIAGRMLEVGWESIRLQAWPPDVERAQRAGHSPIGMKLWRIPDGWEDYR